MKDWNKEPDKQAVFDALADVVKAAASGRRLEVLELLAQGEHSVESLARASGMRVTTVSAHLQTLKRAGLVATRRQGTTIHYRLSSDDVAELFVVAKRVALQHSPLLRDTVTAYLGPVGPGSPATIDPAAVTSAMLVVDVRPAEEFDAGHFPGAVSIPLGELEARAGELPTDRQVVVYCRGEFCRMAREAAQLLCERGVDARAMDKGVLEWRVSHQVDLHDIA